MTTQKLTLADFLLARIAEDERMAEGIHPEQSFGLDLEGLSRNRLLAECEAKRRIVEPWRVDGDEVDWRFGVHAEAHDRILKILAEQYADHPDYREEWRPMPALPPWGVADGRQ